jgi:hypothetical protein
MENSYLKVQERDEYNTEMKHREIGFEVWRWITPA